MWRNGTALRPYFEDVQLVVQLKDSIPELAGFSVVEFDKLSFVHFPIKDCGITDDARVLELARNLVKAIADGEKLYLHCWGGHGRTGTIVCIMLYLMYQVKQCCINVYLLVFWPIEYLVFMYEWLCMISVQLNPVEAMARCQFVHDLRECPVVVGSPQTQQQRDQVTRIINRLISTSARFLRRTISDIGDQLTGAAGALDSPNREQQQQQQQHSPRAPDAAAITHHKGEGHAHFPIGSHLTDFSAAHPASLALSAQAASASTSSSSSLPFINGVPSVPSAPKAVMFRREDTSCMPPQSPGPDSEDEEYLDDNDNNNNDDDDDFQNEEIVLNDEFLMDTVEPVDTVASGDVAVVAVVQLPAISPASPALEMCDNNTNSGLTNGEVLGVPNDVTATPTELPGKEEDCEQQQQHRPAELVEPAEQAGGARKPTPPNNSKSSKIVASPGSGLRKSRIVQTSNS